MDTKITEMLKNQQDNLYHLAHYVWWIDKKQVVNEEPLRVLANAMRYANNDDEYRLLYQFGENVLKEVLKEAQAGWFDEKNWNFWHLVLYNTSRDIPPLPTRKIQSTKD